MQQDGTSRRQALRWLGCAVPLLARGIAWADDLPLHTTGLEHFGLTFPDPEATEYGSRRRGRSSGWIRTE
jgi:hypothetical protein